MQKLTQGSAVTTDNLSRFTNTGFTYFFINPPSLSLDTNMLVTASAVKQPIQGMETAFDCSRSRGL